jgi:outer membrane protein TolC
MGYSTDTFNIKFGKYNQGGYVGMYKNYLCFVLIYFCFAIVQVIHANDHQYSHNLQTLTFAQAADLAVAASVDLRHSRSSHSLMEGAWRWGIREYFPQIGISVSENDRLQQLGSDSFMKNYALNIDQLVFNGGRTMMSRRLERTELNLASSRLDRMASEIAETAIAAYRNILSSRAILEIRRAALGILEEQRVILNEEVQLGLALPVDLANADINLSEARLDILSQQLDLSEMERYFTELLGLDFLPELTEKVDIYRSSVLPAASLAATIAREQNPDLTEMRYSITRREAELRFVSNSWIPALRLNGSFGLTGQRYPLTRYNWSVGLNIDISTPWIQNRFSAQTGWEPLNSFNNSDRTAMVQNSFTPLPDPAARYGKANARLALNIEQENYNTTLERIGRIASNAIEKCLITEQKRILASESAALGIERYRIEEIRLALGQITRLNLMEVLIEQTQREIAVVQAATALLEAERELERFLDLEPGGLAILALNFPENTTSQRRN